MQCWVKCSEGGLPALPLECSMHEPCENSGDATPSSSQCVEEQWASALPTVKIRQCYIECDHAPSAGARRTKAWPIKIDGVGIAVPEFERFIKSQKNMKSAGVSDATRALSRLMDMMEVNGARITSCDAAADPRVLVSLYLSGAHSDMFSLAITHPAHSWTRKLLECLKLYCEFQISAVARQQLLTDDLKWGKYKVSIEQLLAELKGGVAKRVADEKANRASARRGSDRARIDAFPTVQELQTAVSRGMIALQLIAARCAGRGEMTHADQGQATVAMVGICALNGYFGRKKEWQSATADHVVSQLDAGLDYIVCANHKTSRTYGDLAKWLAPGTVAAARCYLQLPRRPDVKSFLCPVGEATDEVDIPSALRRFAARYLPDGSTAPTVNLLRKWYHTKLHAMSSREDTLLQVFKAIDAHSVAVAKKHYVLRGPSDDAKLAEILVLAMLGATVPWPTQKAMEEGADEVIALMDRDAEPTEKPFRIGDGGDAMRGGDDDSEDLEWFDNAHCFGIPKPMVPLLDYSSCAGDHAATQQAQPSAARPATLMTAPYCAGGDRDASIIATDERDRKRIRTPSDLIVNQHAIIHERHSAADTGAIRAYAHRAPHAIGPSCDDRSDAAARDKLPPLFMGGLEADASLSAEDAALNRDASRSFAIISLPTYFKQRYYMSQGEIAWAIKSHAEYEAAIGAKGDKKFFERLYQWGVYTGALQERSSPSGLRSLVMRHRASNHSACKRERVATAADNNLGEGTDPHHQCGAIADREAESDHSNIEDARDGSARCSDGVDVG